VANIDFQETGEFDFSDDIFGNLKIKELVLWLKQRVLLILRTGKLRLMMRRDVVKVVIVGIVFVILLMKRSTKIWRFKRNGIWDLRSDSLGLLVLITGLGKLKTDSPLEDLAFYWPFSLSDLIKSDLDYPWDPGTLNC